MKKVAVIHFLGSHYCYDLFYKTSLIDKILRRKPHSSLTDYKWAECPEVVKFLEKNPTFKYWSSGDTDHDKAYLKDFGLNNEKDIDGLVARLKSEGFQIVMV